MDNRTVRDSVAVAVAGALFALCASATAQQKPHSFKETVYSQLPGADDMPGGRAGYEGESTGSPSPASTALQNDGAAAFNALNAPEIAGRWQSLGPITGSVPGPVTYTGKPSVVSGRITGLAISPHCTTSYCPLFVAAAGGGIWRTFNGLSRTPTWASVSAGLPTGAIGSIAFAASDDDGQTLYVGTGEINGSSDSEAGVGLYRSDDLGESWQLVKGSYSVALYRAIGAIAVDPADRRHLLIGTGVARHGMSGTYGGRFTPPGAPTIGLYESKDGGEHFSLVFSKPQDSVNPATANGSDFFRGGVTKIMAYRPTGAKSAHALTQFYFSVSAYGLYRSTTSGGFEQVFASQAGGTLLASSVARTEFAIVPMDDKLRVYLGDTASNGVADVYRVDNANVPAIQLTNGSANPGWAQLSSSVSGAPGFGAHSFCATQCSYDMFIASPPGRPDTVWIGGQMQYDDIFRSPTLSNGRAVMRSTNAGAVFTDMTNDASDPLAPLGMHPDQHAIVFAPGNPDIAFVGSDGGLVRNDGVFVDTSVYCSAAPAGATVPAAYRALTGAQLANCQFWLAAVPRELIALNSGLDTLQFQGLAFDPNNPKNSLIGGTQDNGTWVYDGTGWAETVGGDGGQAGINALGSKIHTYTGAVGDIQFNGGDPVLGWNIWEVPSYQNPSSEAAAFYLPVIPDSRAPGTWFVGLQHVWRTTDDLGGRTYMEAHCNEFFGDLAQPCGDWQPLGGLDGGTNPGSLTGPAYGSDKQGGWIARIAMPPGSSGPTSLWASTRIGRLFISTNPNAANPLDASFTRIDTPAQSRRFISSIAVDPKNPLRAYVSYVGYAAYNPATPGHVFEVNYNAATGIAKWTDLTGSLGDQPILGVALDAATGRLFAATDYGVVVRKIGEDDDGGSWRLAAYGLPRVAVYELTIDPGSRTLYGVTHGRGIYRLDL